MGFGGRRSAMLRLLRGALLPSDLHSVLCQSPSRPPRHGRKP